LNWLQAAFLGRGFKPGYENTFHENFKRYRVMGVFICALISLYIWFRGVSFFFSESEDLTYTLTRMFSVAALGCMFYFVQLQSSTLNGLKLNLKSSRNAVIGTIIRWIGPFLCLYWSDINGVVILVICVAGYGVEYILSRRLLYKNLPKITKIYIESQKTSWVGFLQVSVMLGVGAITSQMDKLFLINRFTPSDYTKYILMITFCQMPLMFQYPLQRYLLPRYREFFELRLLFRFLAVSVIFFGNLVVTFCAPFLFSFWSGMIVSESDFYLLQVMSAGVMLHTFFSYLQGFLISSDRIYFVFASNVLALISGIFVLVLLSGSVIGSYYWLTIGGVQLFISCLSIWFIYWKQNES
jgi:O-antigen/teichoic acid export membrane protein